jgi:regulator of sigma E protease
MLAYLHWPLAILGALFLFSLAVFIHEFGHFIAARLLGLKADVFSIGFGPALWKKTIKGTEIRFSAIPFGGYVSLPQLDPEGMQKLQGEHHEEAGETNDTPVEILPPAAPWKRIIVAIAGPFGNILLAVICACLIAWCAPEEKIGSSTTLGHVATSSKAYEAGLRPGDTIRAVNETPVASWHELIQECYLAGGHNTNVSLTVEDASTKATKTLTLPLESEIEGKSDLYFIYGIFPAPTYLLATAVAPDSLAAQAELHPTGLIRVLHTDSAQGTFTIEMVDDKLKNPRQATFNLTTSHPYDTTTTIVYTVLEDSPAARAGFQTGDQILAINDAPVTEDTLKAIIQHKDHTTPYTFLVRQADATEHALTLTPDPETGIFGFSFGHAIPGADEEAINFQAILMPQELDLAIFLSLQHAGFKLAPTLVSRQHFPWMKYQAISSQLSDDASGIFRILQALVAPREGTQEASRAAKGLGGPVMIFSILTQMVANGLWISLGFLRLICINLAILNLLPLPVLDGGHTMFALYAIIRRKEPSAKVIGLITNIFAFLLIGLMLWFLFSDIMRFIG